jgi:putative transposase
MNQIRSIKLSKDQRVRLSDGVFKVLRRLAHYRVQFEHEETGELRVLSDTEVGQLWLSGDLTFADDALMSRVSQSEVIMPDPASFPEEIFGEVERRLAFVRAFNASGLSRTQANAAAFLHSASAKIVMPSSDDKEKFYGKPSARTLLRWVATLGQAGARIGVALAPDHHRKGNRKSRLTDDVEEIICKAINEVYMRRPRNTMADVYGEVRDVIEKRRASGERIEVPAASTIRRRIRAVDGYERMVARHGKRAANVANTPVGRFPEPDRPLQLVQIDHTRLDVFVYDDVGRKRVVARATLTIALDVYSRAIWGFHISFDPPSYVAILNCLWHGIRPKDEELRQAGVDPDGMPCLGLPEGILIDNGKDFHSIALRRAAAVLGITIIYAPVGAPQRKPHVERVIGTFNREVAHRMPGTTFSNIKEKGDYQPKKEAVHDIAFLRNRAMEWVANIYHRSPHHGIGEPPLDRWNRGIERHPPVLPPSVHNLRVLLCKPLEEPTLSRHGVQVEGLRYNSGKLMDILAEAGEDRIKVEGRIDPEDIGSIYVMHPRTKSFIEVPCLDVEYARGLSLFAHRELLKRKREAMKEAAQNPELVAAKGRFRRSLQGPNLRKKAKPGGACEARKLGSKLDAAIRDAVANGGGASPGWAVEAQLAKVEKIVGDGRPVATEAPCTNPATDTVEPEPTPTATSISVADDYEWDIGVFSASVER